MTDRIKIMDTLSRLPSDKIEKHKIQKMWDTIDIQVGTIFLQGEKSLNIPPPESGNLERWAKQGVLLLNASLTVRAHEAGSHQRLGWEVFTDAVISAISERKEHVVFLLWGGYAKKKGAKVNLTKHAVFSGGHPSPLSANRGYWFGNNHFKKTNTYLKSLNLSQIVW